MLIPVLGKCKQEDLEFKVTLGFIVSSKLIWYIRPSGLRYNSVIKHAYHA